jgi:beta-N-acetylhexosaminidase
VTELERAAGSVLCVGFPGDVADAPLLEKIAELAPGGLILFAHNIAGAARARDLVSAIRAACDDAPIVAIDQEGGRVVRLRTELHIPAAMAVAAANDGEAASALARGIASELRGIGVDLNFAPVADLALDPRNGAIGTRAYSDDPAEAARFVAATVSGLQSGGVAATLKHFPGHGATGEDSHLTLPVIASDSATLRAREFVPFRAGIDAGARAVMLGHLMVPALDPQAPASLSDAVVNVLRGELGFARAIFTDCLEMSAIAGTIGTAAAAVRALGAGVDGILISHDLELARTARDAIVAAVERGDLPPARLAEAAARLRALRAPHDAAAFDGREAAATIARGAITLLRGDPVVPAYRAVNVVSFEGASRDGVDGELPAGASLHAALRARRFQAESLRVALEPTDAMIEHLVELIAAQSERTLVVVTRRAHRYPSQARAVTALLAASSETILISAADPFDVAQFAQAPNVLCSYGDDETTIEALADVLAGRLEARGRLPVALEPVRS